MNPRSACLIGLSMILIAAGCSDTGVGPAGGGDEDDTGPGGLVITYETEPANAASVQVTPDSGGTVTASGSNGVTYSLEVAPGAVDSALTITLTPLSQLVISIMDTTIQVNADCPQGALFEPTGLEFDSAAVLTVTYPASGLGCLPTGGLKIVSIDSTSAFYEIMPTTVDLATSTLVCTITHFSGYGTDNVDDYDFLKYLIEETVKAGADFPGYDIVVKLLSYAKEAAANGWNDLSETATDGARPILEPLVSSAVSESQADPSASAMKLLQRYYDIVLWFGFSDMETELKNAMDGVTRAVASRGQALCGNDEHAAGRSLLKQALEWAMLGLVNDAQSFSEQVDGWLADCGEVNLDVSVSNTTLRDVALSADDHSTFTTFDIHLTTYLGAPMEGENVGVSLYNQATGGGGTVASGTTDDAGHVMLRYAWGPNESERAGAYRAVVFARSVTEEVDLELLKNTYTLRLNWDYSYSHTSTGFARVVSASYSGVGTGTGTSDPSCAPLTRTFTSHHEFDTGVGIQSYDLDLLDPTPQTACLFSVKSARQSELIDGINTPISRLVRVQVYVDAPNVYGDLVEVASGPPAGDNYVDTTGVNNLRSNYGGTYYSDGDLYLEYDPSSGFDIFSWDKDTDDGYGSGSLSITFSVEASALHEDEAADPGPIPDRPT